MTKKIIKLGEKVMVSDPCYGLDTWCQGVLENVLPGDYNCKVEHIDEGVFGVRVAAIEAIHQDARVIRYEAQDFEVGVDSGTAGIFDYDYYVKYHKSSKESDHCDDNWYDRIYDLTCENIPNPNYIPFVETSNYKAGILAYRNELDEFIKRNSESNAEIVEHANLEYMKLINNYYALDEKSNLPNLSDLIETLNKINALLEDNDDNAKK